MLLYIVLEGMLKPKFCFLSSAWAIILIKFREKQEFKNMRLEKLDTFTKFSVLA